jgi:hypothetical protein
MMSFELVTDSVTVVPWHFTWRRPTIFGAALYSLGHVWSTKVLLWKWSTMKTTRSIRIMYHGCVAWTRVGVSVQLLHWVIRGNTIAKVLGNGETRQTVARVIKVPTLARFVSRH